MARLALEKLGITSPRDVRCHAGLWLDKMPPRGELSSETIGPHVQALEGLPIPEGYDKAFTCRRRAFEALANDGRVTLLVARAIGRVLVGLGAKSALEFGITLDHTWGMPYLPGSALKGLAAATAHQFAEGDAWKKTRDWPSWKGGETPTDAQILFGATDFGGIVQFHDAWWIPEGEKAAPFHADVMTVHHPKYYQQAPAVVPPTDFDEPVPIPFISVAGTFFLAVESDERDVDGAWRRTAVQLLDKGLTELGIGAKTSSGYGRFQLEEQKTEQQIERENNLDRLRNAIDGWKGPQTRDGVVQALIPCVQRGETQQVLEELLSKLKVEEVRAVAEAMKKRVDVRHGALLDALGVPRKQVAQVVSGPVVQEAAVVWTRAKAYAVRDRKNRVELCVGESKGTDIGKLKEKPSDRLKEKLLGATKENPIDVEVLLAGDRLRGVRECAG
jgi:CRISPR-associated protein Cmr6